MDFYFIIMFSHLNYPWSSGSVIKHSANNETNGVIKGYFKFLDISIEISLLLFEPVLLT